MRQRGCISGPGCLIVLALLLLLGLATWLQGGPLLASPGPLSTVAPRATPLQGFRSHAEFENECSRCHAPPWGREHMADRCLACHTKVAEAMAREEELHGRLREPRKCKVCHTEHQGREARLTRLGVAEFPHQVDTVGFTLDRHQENFDGTPLDCQQCHTQSLSALDQRSCIECHDRGHQAFMDQHRADLGEDCLSCHDGSGKLANFDHDQMTSFQLMGQHRKAKCQDCHVEGQFRGLKTACVGCHQKDDKHRGKYGTSCEDCHTPEDWERSTFRHDLVSFTLEGQPLDIATNCVTCHRQDDRHEERLGTECQTCHTPEAWDMVAFDHDQTDFRLTGKHTRLECEECHAEDKLVSLESTCVSCHRQDDAHDGQYGTSCERCHVAEVWDRVTFDHTITSLMYNGQPLDVATRCAACHLRDDAHNGKFGEACYECHVPDGWDQVTFDHNQTRFPLAGAHLEVACEQCHIDQRFAGIPTDCADCHPEPRIHVGLLGTRCGDCHTVDAWSPALLPEHTFPLNHRSRTNIACDVCHDQGTFRTYTCYNCHEHNPAKIERKHLKEGIPDFQDCMKCHPTGREHEGERGEREGRKGKKEKGEGDED